MLPASRSHCSSRLPLRAVGFALAATLTGGCAARDDVKAAIDRGVVQPGLVNGPRLGSDTPPFSADAPQDAIANGARSCPASPERGDPLPQRYPACPGAPERSAVSLTSAVLVAAPKTVPERWKFHLEGLPPCEDLATPWASNDIGAVCSNR